MPLTPDEFYRHAVASADEERRLPLSRMTGWDISPFEPDHLRVSPLRPPVTPEPPRHGEDPDRCGSCQRRDEGIWSSDRWRLTRTTQVGVPLVLMLHPRDHHDLADLPDELAGELGVLSTHIARHVEALPHIGRCHVYRIGDGGPTSTSGSSPARPGSRNCWGRGSSSGTTCSPSTRPTSPIATPPPSRTRWWAPSAAGAADKSVVGFGWPDESRTVDADGGPASRCRGRPVVVAAGRSPGPAASG